MSGRGRGRPARQLGEGDRDGVLEIVGQPAEAGAEDDPDLGHEVRPGADRRLERGEPGGLIGGRDRARTESTASLTGVRASGCASRGKTAEARGFDPPDGVPTPGCRSQSAGRSSPRGR